MHAVMTCIIVSKAGAATLHTGLVASRACTHLGRSPAADYLLNRVVDDLSIFIFVGCGLPVGPTHAKHTSYDTWSVNVGRLYYPHRTMLDLCDMYVGTWGAPVTEWLVL
eukprot:2092918-Pyramimonas_sp.AAC.1